MNKEYLLWLFDYNKDVGTLTRKNHWCAIQRSIGMGRIAGSHDAKGYRVVKINNKPYKIHKIIWFLEGGKFTDTIDHINGVRDDNRIINLRAATTRRNCMNKSCHRNGKLVGTSYSKSAKQWRSRIQIEGKEIFLGYFSTELGAHLEYMRNVPEEDGV